MHSELQTLSVAVIGGGAAGLAAARQLLRAGHRVTVLEARHNIGGVWEYTDEVEDHPLGRGAHHVHGSMYQGLRTNLPREVMGFAEFPFDTAFPGSQDPRQFCGHEEVQRYLEAYADAFGLRQHVRLGTEVQRVAPIKPAAAAPAAALPAAEAGPAADGPSSSSRSSSAPAEWPRWEVTARPVAPQQHQQQHPGTAAGSRGASSTEQYDAVVVANGHYSRPRLPALPGEPLFPGLVMHSHNYRTPQQFRGQRVVLLGASSSGVDIAEEVAHAGAKEVYLCAREWVNPLTGQVLDISDPSIPGSSSNSSSSGSVTMSSSGSNSGGSSPGMEKTGGGGPPCIIKAPNLAELHADGSVTLADGSIIADVDVVMYATGYEYSFPFLEPGLVTTDDTRVAPLYQHVFPPALAPTLAFVGLCWKVVPFPQVEVQSRWIASVLAGTATLPSRQEMERETAEFYASLAAEGVPPRYTHRQSGSLQWEYARWLAAQCGDAPVGSWREEMYTACGLSRKLNAGRYRDAPLPDAEAAEAAAREEAQRVRQQQQQQQQQQQGQQAANVKQEAAV